MTLKYLTLLHFSLSTLEEVEGIGGFGVHVLHNRENIQDVFLCEGWLVAAVKVILFYQDLEGRQTGEVKSQLISKEDGSLQTKLKSYLDTSFD